MKSKSLKFKDSFGKSHFTFRSFLTFTVRLSEGDVLLNLLSNLLFFFAAILQDEFFQIAKIGNGPITPQQIVF